MRNTYRFPVKYLFLLLAFSLTCFLYAHNDTSIDLRLIPKSAYQQDRLYIKITEEASNILKDELLTVKRGIVTTGISELDMLNKEFNVTQYKPLLHNIYEISSASVNRRHLHRQYGFHLWFELNIDRNADIREAVSSFSMLDSVGICEPVYRKSIIEPVNSIELSSDEEPTRWSPNDPHYQNQWPLRNFGQTIQGNPGITGADISIEEAWEIEKGLQDVIVAVFDQGIAYNHPDIQANMWPLIGPQGENTVGGSHGTHVGGTISAVTNNGRGVAGIAGGSGAGDGVKLMSCPIFAGGGDYLTQKVYATDNGAAISQNSWAYTEFDVYNQVDLNAIDYFNDNAGGTVLNGGITIFGAGNDNVNRIQYPAYYAGAIAVASSDNRDRKSDFSNYGTWIDITAPGTNIMSTTINNSYMMESGTSMACPHVSGVVALIISYAVRNNVILTSRDLKEIILLTADDIYQYNQNFNGLLGSGRLNAYAALIETQESYFGIDDPQALIAMAHSSSEIVLQWIPNTNNDNIMIAASLSPQFGVPTDGTFYNIGHLIPGGGSIIYFGDETTYRHQGLGADQTYHYKAFSYNSFLSYSAGIITEAATHSDTSINDDSETTKLDTLFDNYPNPFNPRTTITFSLENPETVSLEIFDIKGSLVVSLIDSYLSQGTHQKVWTGISQSVAELPAGIYIYRLTTPSYTASKKMLLLK